jgi:ABC-type multidrug transport system fused ATPase/permease subunit
MNMESTVFKFIIRFSWRQQITITILSLASFVPYYYYLLMPKQIVNQGIVGKGVTFPIDPLGMGVVLDQAGYLFLLTGTFLVLVLVQQAFKYAINVLQGITGERMLRRLRYELYARILRFPLPVFKNVSAGEIIPMITAEVEPLGGFIAEAFALPVFQGGMLLVIFGFLVAQSPQMALAAVALYPLQFYLVPKLQRRVNALAKERVRTQRILGDRIGESIAGVQEVHADDASRRLRAEFSRRLGQIYWIRYEIYQRKFVIKFINNFIQQLGPFFFYSIGGFLTIKGELDVGTIIAVVAAHKEMASPWKELLTYYQSREDIRIKYEQVISQFRPDGLRDASRQTVELDRPVRLGGPLTVSNLSYADERGEIAIDGLSFAAPLPGRIAIVGGAGRDELCGLLAGLLDPLRGRILFGQLELAALPETVTGRRIGFVGPSGFVFNSTIGDNLYLGLRNRPTGPAANPGDRRQAREISEAVASGGSIDDPAGEWTNYAAAGASDEASLQAEAMRVLKMVALDDDVYQLGLRVTLDPATQPEFARRVLLARRAFQTRLADPAVAELVESWDRSRYNNNATVAENLMFGTPVGDLFDIERLGDNPYVHQLLTRIGLGERFVAIGLDVAKTMVELFADLPPEHEFFQQFSFISSDELPEFQAIIARAGAIAASAADGVAGGPATLGDADRRRLMSLPFKLIPARHRLGHVDAEFQAAVLKMRETFAADLPEAMQGAVSFFDRDRINGAVNLIDNIVFGKVAYGQAQASEKVGRLIAAVIDELGLRDAIVAQGFGFRVGIGGTRLTPGQRQKLAIARAVIKHPDVLILSEATAALDSATQATIMQGLFDEFSDRGLIWSLHNAALAKEFDRVLVMRDGRCVQNGTFAELDREGSEFKRVLARA